MWFLLVCTPGSLISRIKSDCSFQKHCSVYAVFCSCGTGVDLKRSAVCIWALVELVGSFVTAAVVLKPFLL